MPELELSTEEQAIIAELQSRWDGQIAAAVAPLHKQIQSLQQRSSRPPGYTGMERTALETPASLSSQLADNAGFQAFTKTVLGRNASFACELRLPPSRKAATPVIGISPTEYLPQRIWGPAQFPLRLREIMPVLPVTSGNVEYTKETSFTPSAAVVPEGTVKPPMLITFAEATAKCATVASIVKASKQSLSDTALMNTWLNTRLGYSVALKEEDMLINGDAANSISGLLALATPFSFTPASTDTGMDVIAHAIGQLMGQGYAVDGVILNAADYIAMRLLKTTVGSYIFMGTAATGPDDESLVESPGLIWQTPMVVSPSVAPGTFVVGAFQQSTILFSRELLTIEIAFENEDDFIRNLICLRGELRSGLAVPVPAGILKGTLPAGSMTQATHGTITGKPIGK